MRRMCLAACLLLFVGCSSKTDPASDTTSDQPKSREAEKRVPTNIDKVATVFLTRDEIAQGWIHLFDGESLFGWTPNSKTDWRVEDGVIVGDSGERGLLQTSFQFADFEFRCDFRLEKGGNSGVFLRTAFQPANPAEDCYELNMCDTHDSFPTGSFVGRARAADVPPTDGEWHTWHVTCQGTQLTVQLDGTEIVSLDDSGEHQRAFGHIGLQRNEGRIEFRNIAMKPLGMQDLFDGSSLAGWREVPGGSSEFGVSDGAITVTGGPGFLETSATFDNFILQSTVRTDAVGLNSGIFFRALPGTVENPSHGYEMQINNAVADQDPARPLDAGTGAIFRRQAARLVNGKDKQWTTTSLIAQGDHIGAWVNGLQVVDWRDEREPHENPRKGRKLGAGHLSVQGHDPTTSLKFRSLKLAPAPFE